MQYSSQYLENLIRELSHLPGIGSKTAQRLAFHILRVPAEEAIALARAIEEVRTQVGTCSECGNIAEGDRCNYCADPKRDPSLLCVVEQPSDAIVLERTARYRGLYHVLRGALSPSEGIGPEQLGLEALRERVRQGCFREIIIATNPTAPGEATAYAIRELLRNLPVAVSRIARGVPVGSDLELSDAVTLTRALEGRKEM